ncbi:amidohydrolase [Gluconacetobacter aggeris]|uniref:Amidohydrolase n=1 Tax=Gluconacetobacter aggeris TaxID=1286186 RepID=A0A7W4IVI6_9PROT|nr:amidohydrolase [Gluconacetobacter aggeris]MBB2169855.1 amidohydrolase [Gluconacetobacter aggeris]
MTRSFRDQIAGAIVACMVLPSPSVAREGADIIFHNGKVLTVDRHFSVADAVAIRGDRILAVGDESILDRFDARQVIDLHHHVLMPGFTDTHVHMLPMSHRQVSLEGAKSIADIQARLKQKASVLKPGEWITGNGWDEAQLAERRVITHADIDAAVPDNPVLLTRAGGHSAVGNALAMKLAHIGRATPDPVGGIIEHDAAGEPTGIVRERVDLYRRLIPLDSWEELKPTYVASIRRLIPLGITSFHSATTSIDDEPVGLGGIADPPPTLTFRRLQAIYRQQGEALPRVTTYIAYPGARRLAEYPHHSGYGDDRVRLGGIGENLVDGGFTGPTAWLLADYKGQPGFRGRGFFTDARLQEMVDTAARTGWQMALHTIGDAAIVQTVRAYDKALATIPGPDRKGRDRRWFLCHFTIMPPEATMETMARDGIMIVQQPNFLYDLERRYEDNLDDWRLAHNNAVATPNRFGLRIAFSSDNLPIGPMVGLYAAITRKGPDGRVLGGGEAVSRTEAIRHYTIDPAYFSWEENSKGSIEPGKLADMIVLDQDIMTEPEQRILDTHVQMVMIGGRIVYRPDIPL